MRPPGAEPTFRERQPLAPAHAGSPGSPSPRNSTSRQQLLLRHSRATPFTNPIAPRPGCSPARHDVQLPLAPQPRKIRSQFPLAPQPQNPLTAAPLPPAQTAIEPQVTEAFDWGVQRDSKGMISYEAPKKTLPVLGQHSNNVDVKDGLNAIRRGGADADAVVVGSTGVQLNNPAQMGRATFTWTIRKTKNNDGLGIYLGVADSATDFNSSVWGKAWTMGCHSASLFEFANARGPGQLLSDGLPGSEDSLTDGSTVTVEVCVYIKT